jgi:RNA-directed DNA polymerase
MKSIGRFIGNRLKLVVNQEKSGVRMSKDTKFLGMTIIGGTIAIASASMNRAMAKVKELIPRGTYQTMEKALERINEWYMGWSGYYRMTQYPSQLRKIEAHIRRRLRSRLIGQQKRRRHLFDKLRKRGIRREVAAKMVFSNKGRWAMSGTYAIARAYPNRWFAEMGLKIRSDEKHAHWFSPGKWIRLT